LAQAAAIWGQVWCCDTHRWLTFAPPPMADRNSLRSPQRGGTSAPESASFPPSQAFQRDTAARESGAHLDDEESANLLEDAIANFEKGDYAGAEAAAQKVAGLKDKAAEAERPSSNNRRCGSRGQSEELSKMSVDEYNPEIQDQWKHALDRLATIYDESGDVELAEAVYLRMLAWREGMEQHYFGQCGLAEQLFRKSTEYNSVDDATWFLRTLRPDDGHAVPEVVVLLALGEQVAAKAAVGVWTLALRPKHRPQITECGGLELLAKAIPFHIDNAELQAAGLGALRLLCQGHRLASNNRKALIARHDGAETVAASMRRHCYDTEIQREGCGALGAMAMGEQSGALLLIDAGAIMLCLEAIVACPDQSVGDAACRTLAVLCGGGGVPCGKESSGRHRSKSSCGSPSVSPMNASSPSKSGGYADEEEGDVLFRVRLRSKSERGLEYCAEQLQKQWAMHKEQQKQPDRIVMQSLLWAAMIFLDDASIRRQATDIVSSVVQCMNHFQGHEQIQVPACGILWRITVGHMARDNTVQLVASSGGIIALCQSMRDLPCHMDLQQLAIGAIRNIAFGSDANKTLVVKAGGMPATVTAMRRYPNDARLQEQAIGALTSLCDTVGRAVVCARIGGIEAIIAALRRHASVGHVAELGCIILCMFCDEPQIKQQIVRCGAISIAKALSRTANSEAQQWGCELLRDLSDM